MSVERTPRLTAVALTALFAIVPLYGSFLAVMPAQTIVPPLFPRWFGVGVGLLALVACALLVRPGLRARQPAALVFAFRGGGLATIAVAIPGFDPIPGIALGLVVTGFGFAGLALTKADARTVALCIRALLTSAFAASLIALGMLVLRKPAAIFAYDNGRAVGTFFNPNELAAFTLVALAYALPLAVTSRGRDRLAVATAVALLLTLIATLSRWGAVSAVCGLALYALSVRSRRLLLTAAALAIAGAGAILFTGDLHHNPRDVVARALAWRTGWTTFERFPLTGVGPLAFRKTYDVFRPPDAPGVRAPIAFDPHSLPLAFAASGGVLAIGTLFFSALILQRRLYASARGAPAATRALILALGAGMLAIYIECSVNTISVVFPLGYQSLALAIALGRRAGEAEQT